MGPSEAEGLGGRVGSGPLPSGHPAAPSLSSRHPESEFTGLGSELCPEAGTGMAGAGAAQARVHVLSPAAGRCADPPGRPKLDRKVRTDRRGGERRGGGSRARLPRRRGLGGRGLDLQVTCGERPSVRLGATGRPQGSRRTFRTRPAGGGLGHRGAARGRAGRTPGDERGLRQVEQPGAWTAFRGGGTRSADARHPERVGRGEEESLNAGPRRERSGDSGGGTRT